MNLLWEKDETGRFIDIFSSLDGQSTIREFYQSKFQIAFEENQKSNSKSTEFRHKGNAIKETDWYHAMMYYNRSLCYAEIGTENVSLAYAKRSLCFLKLEMYKECLIDIELAIKAKYPQRLMSKLEQRRKFCLDKQIKETKLSEIDVPKLDFEADENFPGMANVLEIKYNSEFGRHFIAKCDIDAGKTVMVEDSFVNSEIWERDFCVCGVCYKSSTNFIACSNCTTALFCCEACAGDNLHKIRCNRSSSDDDQETEFVLRSIARAIDIFSSVESLIEFIEKNFDKNKNGKEVPQSTSDMESKYRVFLNLNLFTNPPDIDTQLDRSWEMFNLILMKPEYAKLFETIDKKRFLVHLCLLHFYVVHQNLFRTNRDFRVILLRNHLNHSCAPNLLCFMLANKSISITSRQIKKGDQLFMLYEPECWDHTRDERQRILSLNYNFQCKCEKCENFNWSVLAPYVRSNPDFQYLCNEFCKTNYMFEDGAKNMLLKQKCITLIMKYGHLPWSEEFKMVCQWFEDLTSTLIFGCLLHTYSKRTNH